MGRLSLRLLAVFAVVVADRAQTPDPVIEAARQAAAAFTASLPNYIVTRTTKRYKDSVGNQAWQLADTVTADVVTENGREVDMKLKIDGMPAKDPGQSGWWSKGEFLSALQVVLSRESNATFTKPRSTNIGGRPAVRYDYSVEQHNSQWTVSADGSSYLAAHGGFIWIDRETSRVLRIEMFARNLPRHFPLTKLTSTVEYAFVKIGEGEYLLPWHSETVVCERGSSACGKNVTDFHDYGKYTADAEIKFKDTGPLN